MLIADVMAIDTDGPTLLRTIGSINKEIRHNVLVRYSTLWRVRVPEEELDSPPSLDILRHCRILTLPHWVRRDAALYQQVPAGRLVELTLTVREETVLIEPEFTHLTTLVLLPQGDAYIAVHGPPSLQRITLLGSGSTHLVVEQCPSLSTLDLHLQGRLEAKVLQCVALQSLQCSGAGHFQVLSDASGAPDQSLHVALECHGSVRAACHRCPVSDIVLSIAGCGSVGFGGSRPDGGELRISTSSNEWYLNQGIFMDNVYQFPGLLNQSQSHESTEMFEFSPE